MIRLISLLFCLIPIFSWSQGDTSDVEIDSTILQADFVPLKFNGKWLWYDIVNNRASDSIYITDFAQKESGFYSIYIVKDSSHWGILNLTGEIVRPFAFDSIILIQNHLFTLFNDEWSYHYSDELVGDSLIPVSFDSLHTYGRDLYLFNEGKTGLILRDGTIISPIYDGIHSFECTTGMGYDGYYISLEGSEYNLLNFGGQELLPKGIWDLRCTEDAIFEFRRGKNPEYYLPYLDEIVSPVGRDIVFYEDRGYKIYTEDKSRSALHLSNGEVLKDQYDDYFLLANDYIAVRKNGKVGLTRNGTQVLGEVKYDQVNPIISPIYENEDYRWYFKFYIGDSCGLMNDQGQEMFDARYANVLTTADDNRFIVLDGNLSGVVDGTGRTVIPLKYNRLSYENGSKQFIVQHNTKVGLFDYNGKQRTPIVYDGYSRLQTFTDGENSDALLVLKKGATYYFANSSGFIDGAGFDHYNYSTDVLKTYSSKAISVFLFDQMGRIEELSNYPIYRNAVIRRNYHDAMNSVGHWANSELEENQQEGYFGLRYYQKRGFGVLPSYRTVRTAIFSDYLAEVEAEKVNFQLTKELSAEVVGGFHHLTLGSGKTNGVSYFSSELSIIKGGSGDRFVNRTADGGQDHAYSKDIESGFIDLSERVHYSDEAGSQSRYRRYFKGGEVELCPIDSSDVSFYDYFKYHNSVDGCRVTPEVMKMILNPKIGVRFKNSRCEIINASVYGLYAGYKTYKSAKGFEKYNYVNRFIFHEKPLDSETGSLQFDYLPRKDEEEVFVDNVLDVSIAQGLFVESNGSYIQTKVKNNQLAKIHLDYPNYFFHQDSIDLNYEAGRVTRRIDSNGVRLITPNGKIVADSCIMIRYLKEDRFAVLRNGGWELIDKNGIRMTNTLYSAVSEFKDNRAEFRYSNGTATVINSDGEELKPLPEPRIFLDEDHYYFASNSAKLINRFSSLTDEAKEGEKYTSRGFFVSKNDGKTKVRRFGSTKNIELKSIPSLKVFGSCLYYKKGKHIYSIDSNLVVTKFKKMNKFRMVTPEIGWLEGKKDQLIDFDWNYICKMTEDQSFEMRDGNLVVLENDSVYKNFGSLKLTSKYPDLQTKDPVVKVFSENGKYGVKQGQETILPLNYGWLSKINDQEFMTRTNSELQLYDLDLERIGNRPFDHFIETYQGNFVFFYNDQIFVLYNDRETFKLLQ